MQRLKQRESFEVSGEVSVKKIVSFIPALLWLILSICHFIGGNLGKGIIFIVCAIGLTVVEMIFIKWQKNKNK